MENAMPSLQPKLSRPDLSLQPISTGSRFDAQRTTVVDSALRTAGTDGAD